VAEEEHDNIVTVGDNWVNEEPILQGPVEISDGLFYIMSLLKKYLHDRMHEINCSFIILLMGLPLNLEEQNNVVVDNNGTNNELVSDAPLNMNLGL